MKNTKNYYNNIYKSILEEYDLGTTKIKDLSEKFKIDRHIVSEVIRNSGRLTNPHGKFKINSDIFEMIDTEEKAYWLGFLFADGAIASVGNGVELSLKLSDKEHLEKFINFLGWGGNVKTDSYRARVCFADSKIQSDLIKHGCTTRKSLTLKFPTTVPTELIRHFIRGYVDGDGSIYYTNDNWYVAVLGTIEFLKDLVSVLNLPIRKYYRKSGCESNTFFFQYSGKNCLKMIDILYNNCNIYLERKNQKYLEAKEFVNDEKRRYSKKCN